MSALTLFNESSNEYNNLKNIMIAFNKQVTHIQLTIQNCYFDMGQNWMYTTLICNDTRLPKNSVLSSWQALSPKDQEIAVYGSDDERLDLIQKLITKYQNQ